MLMAESFNNNFPMDEEEKVFQLRRLISTDPINWNEFLRLDEDLGVLSHEAYDCSFSWILAHSPPDSVLKTILSRYHTYLFSDVTKIKAGLDIALYCSATEVVKFIATHYQHVISETIDDDSGDFPLHRARKAEIASILLEAYPAGVARQNNEFDLPLHVAIQHYQHPDDIRLLVEQGMIRKVGGQEGRGGVLVKNRLGETPFSLLNKQFSTGIDIACLSHPVYETDRRLWENLRTMVYAIHDVDKDNAQNFNILHALITLDCPPEAIQLAQLMVPGQVRIADEKGRYPLSLAAAHTNCSRRVLDNLLGAFPRALHRFDKKGRYPLHWGAAGGRSFPEGTESIFSADIASIPDREGMFPFMLAASSKDGTVDTIYRLLRYSPDVVQ